MPGRPVLSTGATEVADFYRRGTRLHEGTPRTKHGDLAHHLAYPL